MNYNKFISLVDELSLENNELRRGQSIYCVLKDQFPSIAKEILATEKDPFYFLDGSKRIKDFENWLEKEINKNYMKNYTHITLLIDRSGSMETCWNDVTGGYSNIIEENKKAEGKATISTYVFDSAVEKENDFADIKDVNPSLKASPRGMTALFDAIGTAINETGATLRKMEKESRPEKVVFVIQTDGFENASREFTALKVSEMVKNQEEVYSWEFMFLGAGKEFFDQAQASGLGHKFTSYSSANAGQTFSMVGAKLNSMRTSMASGATEEEYTKAMNFTEEEKQELNK